VCHTGTVDLTPYIGNLHSELTIAAEAGGEEARALAERITAPLAAAIRLTLLNVISAAADEITRELAPGSVELRLRGGEPSFVVTPPPAEPADEPLEGGSESILPALFESDDGALSRLNVRLPETLKARIEKAASREGLSANAWLVRAAAETLERRDRPPPERTARTSQRYTGWVR
jgi:hypothetical protein